MLHILSDSRFHSGEDIAKTLGVSRASICNAAKILDDAGLDLDRIRGRGYRLAKCIAWLDMDRILSLSGHIPFDIEIRNIIDSTNSELLRSNGSHGRILAAEMQTSGRGRMGRSWHSAPGGSLAFSASWRFERGAGQLSGLSLAIGVALIRAMKACGIESICLKWPNDVLFNFQKLAGILIEVKGDMLGPTATVIGIGINFRISDRIRDQIDQAVTDIESITGGKTDRNALFAAILRELADALNEFETCGFAPFREEWTRCHAYHMKPVRLRLPSGKIVEGVVTGVSEKGEILLGGGHGQQVFSSGEISLRGAA